MCTHKRHQGIFVAAATANLGQPRRITGVRTVTSGDSLKSLSSFSSHFSGTITSTSELTYAKLDEDKDMMTSVECAYYV